MVCLQPVTNTAKALDRKLEMLDVLSDIEVAPVCLVACAWVGNLWRCSSRQDSSSSCGVGGLP